LAPPRVGAHAQSLQYGGPGPCLKKAVNHSHVDYPLSWEPSVLFYVC